MNLLMCFGQIFNVLIKSGSFNINVFTQEAAM